jgi:ribosomal-protein-alanine N-acetyltransferase
MVPSMLGDVYEIEQAAYAFPWTQGNFADSLAAGYSAWTVWERQKLIAYSVLMLAAGEAHLLNITVDVAEQGRGVGAWLLGEMFNLARGRGAQRLFLEVRPSNTIGRRLYERAGMEQIGMRKRYYPAGGLLREDALVLAINLLPAEGVTT